MSTRSTKSGRHSRSSTLSRRTIGSISIRANTDVPKRSPTLRPRKQSPTLRPRKQSPTLRPRKSKKDDVVDLTNSPVKSALAPQLQLHHFVNKGETKSTKSIHLSRSDRIANLSAALQCLNSLPPSSMPKNIDIATLSPKTTTKPTLSLATLNSPASSPSEELRRSARAQHKSMGKKRMGSPTSLPVTKVLKVNLRSSPSLTHLQTAEADRRQQKAGKGIKKAVQHLAWSAVDECRSALETSNVMAISCTPTIVMDNALICVNSQPIEKISTDLSPRRRTVHANVARGDGAVSTSHNRRSKVSPAWKDTGVRQEKRRRPHTFAAKMDRPETQHAVDISEAERWTGAHANIEQSATTTPTRPEHSSAYNPDLKDGESVVQSREIPARQKDKHQLPASSKIHVEDFNLYQEVDLPLENASEMITPQFIVCEDESENETESLEASAQHRIQENVTSLPVRPQPCKVESDILEDPMRHTSALDQVRSNKITKLPSENLETKSENPSAYNPDLKDDDSVVLSKEPPACQRVEHRLPASSKMHMQDFNLYGEVDLPLENASEMILPQFVVCEDESEKEAKSLEESAQPKVLEENVNSLSVRPQPCKIESAILEDTMGHTSALEQVKSNKITKVPSENVETFLNEHHGSPKQSFKSRTSSTRHSKPDTGQLSVLPQHTNVDSTTTMSEEKSLKLMVSPPIRTVLIPEVCPCDTTTGSLDNDNSSLTDSATIWSQTQEPSTSKLIKPRRSNTSPQVIANIRNKYSSQKRKYFKSVFNVARQKIRRIKPKGSAVIVPPPPPKVQETPRISPIDLPVAVAPTNTSPRNIMPKPMTIFVVQSVAQLPGPSSVTSGEVGQVVGPVPPEVNNVDIAVSKMSTEVSPVAACNLVIHGPKYSDNLNLPAHAVTDGISVCHTEKLDWSNKNLPVSFPSIPTSNSNADQKCINDESTTRSVEGKGDSFASRLSPSTLTKPKSRRESPHKMLRLSDDSCFRRKIQSRPKELVEGTKSRMSRNKGSPDIVSMETNPSQMSQEIVKTDQSKITTEYRHSICTSFNISSKSSMPKSKKMEAELGVSTVEILSSGLNVDKRAMTSDKSSLSHKTVGIRSKKAEADGHSTCSDVNPSLNILMPQTHNVKEGESVALTVESLSPGLDVGKRAVNYGHSPLSQEIVKTHLTKNTEEDGHSVCSDYNPLAKGSMLQLDTFNVKKTESAASTVENISSWLGVGKQARNIREHPSANSDISSAVDYDDHSALETDKPSAHADTRSAVNLAKPFENAGNISLATTAKIVDGNVGKPSEDASNIFSAGPDNISAVNVGKPLEDTGYLSSADAAKISAVNVDKPFEDTGSLPSADPDHGYVVNVDKLSEDAGNLSYVDNSSVVKVDNLSKDTGYLSFVTSAKISPLNVDKSFEDSGNLSSAADNNIPAVDVDKPSGDSCNFNPANNDNFGSEATDKNCSAEFDNLSSIQAAAESAEISSVDETAQCIAATAEKLESYNLTALHCGCQHGVADSTSMDTASPDHSLLGDTSSNEDEQIASQEERAVEITSCESLETPNLSPEIVLTDIALNDPVTHFFVNSREAATSTEPEILPTVSSMDDLGGDVSEICSTTDENIQVIDNDETTQSSQADGITERLHNLDRPEQAMAVKTLSDTSTNTEPFHTERITVLASHIVKSKPVAPEGRRLPDHMAVDEPTCQQITCAGIVIESEDEDVDPWPFSSSPPAHDVCSADALMSPSAPVTLFRPEPAVEATETTDNTEITEATEPPENNPTPTEYMEVALIDSDDFESEAEVTFHEQPESPRSSIGNIEVVESSTEDDEPKQRSEPPPKNQILLNVDKNQSTSSTNTSQISSADAGSFNAPMESSPIAIGDSDPGRDIPSAPSTIERHSSYNSDIPTICDQDMEDEDEMDCLSVHTLEEHEKVKSHHATMSASHTEQKSWKCVSESLLPLDFNRSLRSQEIVDISGSENTPNLVNIYQTTKAKVNEVKQMVDEPYINLPNGVSFPRTQDRIQKPTDIVECSCLADFGSSSTKIRTAYCQAVDSLDGKLRNCVGRVTASNLQKASTRLPSMILCKTHKKKMISHSCCPTCGIFCVSGEYRDCADGQGHYHHLACELTDPETHQAICPHCNRESLRVEVTLSRQSRSETNRKLALSKTVARMSVRPVPNAKDDSHSSVASSLSSDLAVFDVKRVKGLEMAERSNLMSVFSALDHLGPVLKERLESKTHRNKQKLLYDLSSYILKNDINQLLLTICDILSISSTSSNSQSSNLTLSSSLFPKNPPSTPSLEAETTTYDSESDRPSSRSSNRSNKSQSKKNQHSYPTDSNDSTQTQPDLVTLPLNKSDANQSEPVENRQADNRVKTRGSPLDHHYVEQNRKTALHLAVQNQSLAATHALVASGASVNVRDSAGTTVLMLAVKTGSHDIVRYLVEAGAKLDLKDNDGMTALHFGAVHGHRIICEYFLLNKLCDVNCEDDGGWTPLVWSIEHSHVEIVFLLLSCNADIHRRDKEGNSSIHWAAYSGNTDILRLLLDRNANIESANWLGDRPLHIAVRQARTDAVILLLSKGADASALNNLHETPAECCHGSCSNYMKQFLTVNSLLVSSRISSTLGPVLLHQDISRCREKSPIPVVNNIDEVNYPRDFIYVTENVYTREIKVNNLVTSLSHCTCDEACSRATCVCARSSITCWYDADGRLSDEFDYATPPILYECNKMCSCWLTCSNRLIQHGISVTLELFKTRKRGWGVRCIHDIPKGTFVCEYIGEVITDLEADHRSDDQYLFDLDTKNSETFCIDARHYGNVARFINHKCQPNLVPVSVFVEHQDLRLPRIALFANVDIPANTELGFDYGEKFWLIKYKEFLCDCGSSDCKYNATSIQDLLKLHNLNS